MSSQIPSNLNSSTFGNITNNIPGGALSGLKSTSSKLSISSIDKIKGKLNDENTLKNINDPNSFLSSQSDIDSTQAVSSLAGVILPLLTKFINAEKSANAVIDKLINDTKKKLKDKGRIEIVNGTITFVPKDNGNYQVFKNNFDRKVKTLKTTVGVLKNTIDTLTTLLKTIRIALAAFKIQLALKKKKLQIEAVAANANLQIPQTSYPAAAQWVIDKQFSDDVLKKLEDKINQYILIINYITSILQIFKKLVDSIKVKIDTLSFTIGNLPIPDAGLLQTLNETPSDESTMEESYNNYIIRIVTLPNGAIQAVAYDKFSMMKITQTAPSKIKLPDQLLEEIKLILG